MRTFAGSVALLAAAACSAPPMTPVVTEEQARAKREACTFGAGALTKDTLATATPQGEQLPVQHVVLVMQENRSFDHYFSKLSHGGVRVAPEGVTNTDANGMSWPRTHLSAYCVADLNHTWAAQHAAFADGKNDGFVTASGGARALGYFDDGDLPYYYALARTFAMSDAHFASVMGPTQPNRLYYFAGTSFGTIANTLPPLQDSKGHPYPNLFTRLTDAHVSWKVYSTNAASPAVFLNVLTQHLDQFRPVADYFTDAMADTLPQVAIVESNYGGGVAGGETDEHSPSNVQLGQQFSASVVNALLSSPAWPKSVLFFSHDECGGYYDSVPPGKACKPDGIDPIGADAGHFDQYGFRVPLIAVSPFAKRGYVSHVVSDHTSIIRFISARWGLPALTARDANADALMDLFDFAHPDTSVPALPQAVVDQAQLDRCHADFP